MKIETEKETKVMLHLNETEAKWLKGIMQNPFFGQDLEAEAERDYDMRSLFWNALDSKGVKLDP